MIFGVSLSFESQNRISSIPLIVECGNSCNGVFCFDCGVFVWIWGPKLELVEILVTGWIW